MRLDRHATLLIADAVTFRDVLDREIDPELKRLTPRQEALVDWLSPPPQ